jgi:DNA topoisomerase-3
MVPRTYEQYEIEINAGSGERFKATIRKDINSGFRKLYKEEEKEDGVQDSMQKPDKERLRQSPGLILKPEIEEIKRSRPKYYTPATLITAMQTCGRTLENEEARKMLANTKGIGTPATQAHYPRQLLKYEYIIQKNGSFISTQKGRRLIDIIAPDLKTPELTAEWEMDLRLVEKGSLSAEQYRTALHEFIKKIIRDAKSRFL